MEYNMQEQETSVAHEQTHVMRELEDQPGLLEAIEMSISSLEKRLAIVLRDNDSTDVGIDEPHMLLVPLAEQIHSNNNRLRFSRDKLRDILNRLEL